MHFIEHLPISFYHLAASISIESPIDIPSILLMLIGLTVVQLTNKTAVQIQFGSVNLAFFYFAAWSVQKDLLLYLI